MRTFKQLVLFGAGPQGRVALDILRTCAQAVRAFVDDALAAQREVAGVPVWTAAEFQERATPADTEAFVAVGNNDARRDLAGRLRRAGFRVRNVIHPSAQVLPSVRLGSGILVCPLALVGAGVVLDDDAVLNSRCSVDHDSHVGPGAYLAPGVTTAGGVRVGERAFVGLGALLGPGVQVGAQAVVGAGATVLQAVPPLTFAAGTPARLVRRLRPPLDYRRLLAGQPGVLEERAHAA